MVSIKGIIKPCETDLTNPFVKKMKNSYFKSFI